MSNLIQLKGIERFAESAEVDQPSSILNPPPSILDPQSSIVDPQSSILDPPSSILDPPSSILNPRTSGKQYWRSLEELADTDEFQELLHREFPEQATEWSDPVGRRKFLKLMGASFALAGLTACTRQPAEYIAPYVRQPEELVPGKPVFFATAMLRD